MLKSLDGKVAALRGLSTDDLSYLSRMTSWLSRDAQEAEDIAQETWLAYHTAPPIDPSRNRQWLRTVARRIAARMRARRTPELTLTSEPMDPRTEFHAAANKSRTGQVQELVGRACNSLPERYQQVVEMRFYEDLKPAHIGQRLGLSVNTVNSRLQRAQVLLREKLEPERKRDLSWLSAFFLAPFRRGGRTAQESGGAVRSVWASFAPAALVAGLVLVSVSWWLAPTTRAASTTEASAGLAGLEQTPVELRPVRTPVADDSLARIAAVGAPASTLTVGGLDATRVRVAGTVTDRLGRGLAEASLFAWTDGEHAHPLGTTNPDGSFELWVSPHQRLSGPLLGADGSIGISARAEGYANGPVRVLPEGMRSRVPLRLSAAPAHIDLRLVDEIGEPIDGAQVLYSAECADVYGPNADGSLNWDPPRSASRVGLGSWSLRNLAVGSGTIRIEAPGYAIHVIPVPAVAGTHQITIHCSTGRTLSGQFVDANQVPQAHVEVHALAFNSEDDLVVQTDADGRFSITHLDIAHARLFARSSMTTLAWETTVAPGEDDVDLGTIELAPLGTYRFRLVDSSTEPLSNVVVMLRSGVADAGWSRIVRTDRDGWAELDEAPFERIRVWPFFGDRQPQAGFPLATFELERGIATTFELDLTPPVRWDVSTGRRLGFAPTGSYLRLRQLATATERRRILPPDGRLQLELPAGRYFASYYEPRTGEALMGFIDVKQGLQSQLFASDPGRVVISADLASSLSSIGIEQTYGPHISLTLKFLKTGGPPETEYELMSGHYRFKLERFDGEVEVRRIVVESGATVTLWE